MADFSRVLRVMMDVRRPETRAAFEGAVAAHQPELRTFAFRMLRSETAAEDCLQDALLRAHEAIRAGSQPQNMRAWLYAFVRNAAVDMIRRENVRARALREVSRSAAAVAARSPDSELESLVADLPEPHAEILWLRYAHGLSYAEIETILGRPAGTLRVYAARGLRMLQEKLSGRHDDLQ
jgi:RNA polymerase sigma-70 factor, ECF subfamily